MFRRFGIALAGSAALCSCAVGPNFKRPNIFQHAQYQPQPLLRDLHTTANVGRAGEAQRLVIGADVNGEWWTEFKSPVINLLVARARAHSPTLKAAQATLKAAYEVTKAEGAILLPSLSASFNPTRNKTAHSLSPVPDNNSYLYNLHTAQLNIAYTPDLWGGLRRRVEAQAAEAELSRFELIAATNTLINTLLETIILQANVSEQIHATEDIVRIQRHVLEIMQKQYALGDISLAQLLAQQAALSKVAETLPPLRLEHVEAHDQIAALIGTTPDEVLPEVRLSDLSLPESLPVSLPSKLLMQRPDIRAAEAMLHNASAEVGVAIANRLPDVLLTATPGQAVNRMSQFFLPGYGNWMAAAMITQPIFEGGALLRLERQAQATLLAQTQQYRATVLAAIQNVADTLHALKLDAETLDISAENERAAVKSLAISRSQLSAGDISPVLLQTAVELELTARIDLIEAKAARYSDSVALFQAIGGGWWHRKDEGAIAGDPHLKQIL